MKSDMKGYYHRSLARSNALILAGLSVALVAFADKATAFNQHTQPAGQLETAGPTSPRKQPTVRVGPPPVSRMVAYAKLIDHVGSRWNLTWDRATNVPRRIFGEGLQASGSVQDADAAAAFARAFLARHIDLLAPGSTSTDFILVSNQERRGIRVVGFVQSHAGLRVVGGQVSFRFKNDRLVVIGSEALPNVSVQQPNARLPVGAAQVVGATWLLEGAASAQLENVADAIILPIIGENQVHGYHVAVPVTMRTAEPLGKWDVYVDAASGDRVARGQTLMFADAELRYNAPVRLPTGERRDYPVPDTAVQIDGLDLLSTDDSSLVWSGDNPGSVIVKTTGTGVRVFNQAGPDSTATFTIAPQGTVVWDMRNDELVDAEITAYVHTQIVKAFARVVAPELPFLDVQQVVNVNINESCNAFSDGNTINFFQESPQCANTARLPDVVYHEYGHSLHANSVIEGVGFFNSAHSEGLSDFLAASITGDPAMARGFFQSNAPLRHLNPADDEYHWPEDIGGPHTTGLIFGGAMWDLRTLLIQKLGETEGAALSTRLWYATLERASDIPSTYVEVLLEDDDDGNLANGTPNACDINAAFGPHGLRNLAIDISPLAAALPNAGGFPVSVSLGGLFEQCPGDQIETVTLGWRLQTNEPDVELEAVELTENDGLYVGTIPSVDDASTVSYAVTVTLADLTALTFPDNPADRLYQFYVGETIDLYCTDFTTDPFTEGWRHGQTVGAAGGDDWAWGIPSAPSGSQDPDAAFVGDFVVGNDLGENQNANGRYPPDVASFLETPIFDVGSYTDVRLQYRRWLTVEDGFFDSAAIAVNGRVAWSNLNSDMGNSSSIHHEDREWRFHDLALSEYAKKKQVQLSFSIQSDAGLEFGGWTIDDFCIVANVNSICGDGNITGAENCDEGLANDDFSADACRTDCRAAACGDGVIDQGEECDDGNEDPNDECSGICKNNASGGGCCQVGQGGSSGGTLALILVVVAFTWRRRRRTGRRATPSARQARR